MASDPGLDLLPAVVDRVLPFRDSAAVVLRADDKPFMIFVGRYESEALMREIRGEQTERPLTHDVISYVMTGFDIEVDRVVISSIVGGVFCATLILKRGGEEPTEVRLDIRASDSLVIALKSDVPIWVARRVWEQVEDVSEALERIEAQFTDVGDSGGDEDIGSFDPFATDDDDDDDDDDDENEVTGGF